MFLTRMSLDVSRAETRRVLEKRELLQQAVENSFAGAKVFCLWRLDVIGSRTYLVMLSPLRPTLEQTHEAYGYPGCFPSWETQPDDILDWLQPQQFCSFRLVCAVPEEADPAAWLAEQSEALGFRLGHCCVTERGNGYAGFEGTMIVTDPNALRNSIHSGIGEVKRLGLGLMTVETV